MKRKNLLILFLFGGFLFRWGIELGDLLMASISNKQGLLATKTQLEMNKLVVKSQEPPVYDDGNAIGFHVDYDEPYYEDINE